MKKILLVITMMFVLLITAGCPRQTTVLNQVRTPNAVADVYANTTVVYQLNEGDQRITYVQWIQPQGITSHEGKGKELYTEPNVGDGVGICASMVSTKYGQVFLAWEDNTGLWVQKIDQEARFRLDEAISVTSGRVDKFQTAADGSDGMIIAWTNENHVLTVWRIDMDGNVLWTTSNPGIGVSFFNIAVDDSGNTLIVWEDVNMNVGVQKLNVSGTPIWTELGVTLMEAKGLGDGMQSIISDDEGGAIITWINGVSGDEPYLYIGTELYIQRIGSDGKPLWGSVGVPLRTNAELSGTGMPVMPQLVSDDVGGAFVIWHEEMDIIAQRVNAAGEIAWILNGITVWSGGNSPQSPNFSTITDEAGGCIIVWNYIPEGETLSDTPELHAQRFNADGNPLWNDTAVSSGPITLRYNGTMTITSDNKGGVIIAVAMISDAQQMSTSIFYRIDYKGNRLWGNGSGFWG